MQAVVWSDYLCPWCYLGRNRTQLIESLGVPVDVRGYELHPELPLAGRAVPEGGRLSATFDQIGRQCAEVGMPFNPPTRLPNTRRALQLAELARVHQPEVFAELDRLLAEAVFVHDLDLADHAVLRRLAGEAGADTAALDERLAAGEGAALLGESIEAAQRAGVSGTPAWLVGDTFVLPGVQPPEFVTRVVERLRARTTS